MKTTRSVFLLLLVSTLFFSCKKNSVEEQFTEINNPVFPDFSTQIYTSVSGLVTDENGNAIESAAVRAGNTSALTDTYGYFRIDNVPFAKSAGFVQVSQPGYFTGTKTFIPVNGQQSFIRLQLVSASVAGTVSSVNGGTVSLTDGSSVTLPANAGVVASTGAAYAGSISISMHWLDPSDQQTMQMTMPGDLRAVDSTGNLKTLTTFGMLAVELTGDAGELLQLAPGVKAALHFPLPSALQGSAPENIPLWYFNEQNGLWKEEGEAVKNGNSYEAEVSHFSWWNCDVPNSVVALTAQLINNELRPLANIPVLISISNVPNSTLIVYSDSSGNINCMMPANNNVEIKIINVCNILVYNKSIVTTSNAVDLGTLIVDAQQYIASFKGMVNNCAGQPVTNGFVIIAAGGINQQVEINNGSFERHTIICPGTTANIIAFDRTTSQSSFVQSNTLVSGLNDFGLMQACSATDVETITYSIDGAPATTLVIPFYTFAGNFDFGNNLTNINAFDQINSVQSFNFSCLGDALVGGHPFVGDLSINQQVYIPAGCIPLFTEYGLIGEFIRGNCLGFYNDSWGILHQIEFTFSVRRDS